MKCERCLSEMTPMITSWFCAACDARADDDDWDLIDEDPPEGCLEPDFFSPYIELALARLEGPVGGLVAYLNPAKHRAYRQRQVAAQGHPADFAAEDAVCPGWYDGGR